MGAATRESANATGYGEKLAVRIMGLDKAKSRIECATGDGAMVYAAVWEMPIAFRWPKVGEIWTIRKDSAIWRLDAMVQSPSSGLTEAEPIPLEKLPEGDTRILGGTIHLKSLSLGTKPKVTGGKGGNAALTSLIKALSELGFIIDEST